MKVNKIPQFFMIFARKIPELYMIGLIAPKIFLPIFFLGGGHVPLAARPHTPMAIAQGRLCLVLLLQGDREAELGLPISPLCDRHNTLVAESQIGTYVLYVYLCGPTVFELAGNFESDFHAMK